MDFPGRAASCSRLTVDAYAVAVGGLKWLLAGLGCLDSLYSRAFGMQHP